MIHADLMASKRFRHLDQEWEAVGTGTGSAFGVGRPPIVTRWGVVFRSLSDPERGDYGYRGTVLGSDPGAIPEDQLKLALEEALIVAAIDRSRFTWRTASGIAEETHIPVARVQDVLETTNQADVIASYESRPGEPLFSTRDHFVKTTGDVSKRYTDVESST